LDNNVALSAPFGRSPQKRRLSAVLNDSCICTASLDGNVASSSRAGYGFRLEGFVVVPKTNEVPSGRNCNDFCYGSVWTES